MKRSAKTGKIYWVILDETGNKVGNSFAAKTDQEALKMIEQFETMGFNIKWEVEK